MRALLALLLVALAAAPAVAYPTSSNIIPTADMLEFRSLRLEFENDGYPRLFGHDSENCLLLEYAPDPRLEVGVDLYGLGDADDRLLNAKWLAVSEATRRPAVAVGVLEWGSGYDPVSFAVATKDLGRGFRAHLGGAQSQDERTLLVGAEQQVTERDYLLADYTSWDQGLATLGVWHDFGGGFGLNVAYGWPNDHDASRTWMLNVSWTTALGGDGARQK